MMEFIFVPAVVGIITWGIYSIFELFARRKERMMFVEKLGSGTISGGVNFGKIEYSSKFSGLKWGGLLLGIGLGLLAGFIIGNQYVPYQEYIHFNSETNDAWRILNRQKELLGIIYGSSALLGGGLGLMVAFLTEFKLSRKKTTD